MSLSLSRLCGPLYFNSNTVHLGFVATVFPMCHGRATEHAREGCPGVVPAIHDLAASQAAEVVDGRPEAGYDTGVGPPPSAVN